MEDISISETNVFQFFQHCSKSHQLFRSLLVLATTKQTLTSVPHSDGIGIGCILAKCLGKTEGSLHRNCPLKEMIRITVLSYATAMPLNPHISPTPDHICLPKNHRKRGFLVSAQSAILVDCLEQRSKFFFFEWTFSGNLFHSPLPCYYKARLAYMDLHLWNNFRLQGWCSVASDPEVQAGLFCIPRQQESQCWEVSPDHCLFLKINGWDGVWSRTQSRPSELFMLPFLVHDYNAPAYWYPSGACCAGFCCLLDTVHGAYEDKLVDDIEKYEQFTIFLYHHFFSQF